MAKELYFSTSLYQAEAVHRTVEAYGSLAVFSVEVDKDGIKVQISDIHPSFTNTLIDNFCNHVLNERRATQFFLGHIRELSRVLTFRTAHDVNKADTGIKVSPAWSPFAEFMVMKGIPDLLSVGEYSSRFYSWLASW